MSSIAGSRIVECLLYTTLKVETHYRHRQTSLQEIVVQQGSIGTQQSSGIQGTRCRKDL